MQQLEAGTKEAAKLASTPVADLQLLAGFEETQSSYLSLFSSAQGAETLLPPSPASFLITFMVYGVVSLQ